MTVRNDFGWGRSDPFGDGAAAYLDRVRDSSDGAGRMTRARGHVKQVLTQLVTGKRKDLIYRFSQFYSLSRACGADPMILCFDPPVLPHEAREALRKGGCTWDVEDVLRDPATPDGHQVYVGSIPQLCCFGFIVSDVFDAALLRWDAVLRDRGVDAGAKALASEITRACSNLLKERGIGDSQARSVLVVLKTLEAVAGQDFSLEALRDDDVMEAWEQLASSGDITRFGTLMRHLAALCAAVLAAREDISADQAVSIDDPAAAGVTSASWDVSSPADRLDLALTDELIDGLLTRPQIRTTRQQVAELGDLIGLDLSRARLMTFSPLESQVIGRKKQKHARPAAPAGARVPTVTHAMTLAMLEQIENGLGEFVSAAVFLEWAGGRRVDAVMLAIAAGFLTDEDIRELFDTPEPSVDDVRAFVERELEDAEPFGALARTLRAGERAWQRLRDLKAFKALHFPDALDAVLEAGFRANDLRRTMASLRARIDAAVGDRRDGPGFEAEHVTFRGALARIHGIRFDLGDDYAMD